jgi:hypothetical protein
LTYRSQPVSKSYSSQLGVVEGNDRKETARMPHVRTARPDDLRPRLCVA